MATTEVYCITRILTFQITRHIFATIVALIDVQQLKRLENASSLNWIKEESISNI